jgi:hypothetical protein
MNENFRLTKTSKPEQGDVIARYRAVAEFVEGKEKDFVVRLLQNRGSVISALQVMKNVCFATEKDSYRVLKEMVVDLLEMPLDKVVKKPYEYMVELFYYVKPEHVPKDDPHWEIIDIVNLNDYISVEKAEDVAK